MKQTGNRSAVRQADEREFVSGVGWTRVEVYEGNRDTINGEADALAATGLYSRIRVYSPDNVVYRVNATIAGDESNPSNDIVDTWELLGQDIEEDIFDHPTSRGMAESTIADIHRLLADPDLRRNPDVSFSGTGQQLWDLVKNDKNSYQRGYYLLRHTRTVSNATQITVSFANSNKIHTRAQLPSVPAEINVALNTIENEDAPDGFVFGWLKRIPTITSTFNARPQVIQEWSLYSWSTYVYATVS